MSADLQHHWYLSNSAHPSSNRQLAWVSGR
jgi:hypothetical protein